MGQESELAGRVVDEMLKAGWMVIRFNSGRRNNGKLKFNWWKVLPILILEHIADYLGKQNYRGVPDYLAIRSGRVVFFDVKKSNSDVTRITSGYRLTETEQAQSAFLTAWMFMGGDGRLVGSMNDIDDLLKPVF